MRWRWGRWFTGLLDIRRELLKPVRKMRLPGKDVIEALDAFRILCPSPGSHLDFTHETALKIAGEHGYEIYVRR